MKKLFMLLLMVVTTVSVTLAQRTVTGTVVDEGGLALIGANVLVEGTTVGSITDIDGTFSIQVPDGSNTLVVSYTGFTSQNVDVSSSSNVSITLVEGQVLGELVVTALGIKKEAKTLGYGVDEVDGEDLVKSRSANIVNALQGKVSGVNIQNSSGNLGGSSKILIRGATSLSGRNGPLWVIDGVPFNDDQFVSGSRISGNRDFGNGASVVNPDDIETMSVLKGAAATALYGSRAAAGAIIVTTKRGKASKDGNARVEVNSSYRVDQLFITPDYQDVYTMGSQARYDSSDVGFDWGVKNLGQQVSYLPVTGQPGALYKVEDNGVNDFFKTGSTLINNFSVSDGNDRMDYRVSLGALNQEGVIPGTKLDRYSFNLNAGVKHSDKLQTRFGVQFIKTDTKGTAASGANDPNIIGMSSFSSNLDTKLYDPWIDESGNQINSVIPTVNNPLWIRHENRNDRDDTRLLANLSLTYSPAKNLDLIARMGYDYDIDNRFLSNRKGTQQRIDGDFFVDNYVNAQFNADLIASYSHSLNDDLSLNVLGGYNYNRRRLNREFLDATSLVVGELFEPGNVAQAVAGRDFRDQILLGLYTSVELGYKGWATLTVTGRNDWSSTLPLEDNSYFYPSVSGALVLSEAFDIKNEMLNYVKLRGSYAQVGNDTGPYQLDFNFFPISTARGQYGLDVNFPFDGRLALAKSNIIPPEALRPEQQTSIEIGAELDLFDYRVGLDVAYFKTINKDQILALPIPESTGFASLRTNVGQVNTSGIEVKLDIVPIKTDKFVWESSVLFSNPETKVVELAEGVDRVLLSSAFNSVQVVAVDGGGIELLGIPFLRDSLTGRPLIDPDTGTRLAGETQTFGSVLPDFTMGFINSFSIGNFDISATIDWKSGGLLKSSTVENLQTGGLVQETLLNRDGTFIDADGVIDNGDNTVRDNDVPLANAQAFWTSLDDNSIAEAFIFDASFVKLREVAITYNVPNSLLGNSFIRGLSVGIEGRNLALLYSKIPHIDPEANLFGAGADGWGVERSSSPTSRSVGVNLRLQF